MTWVLHWYRPSDGESNVTLWAVESDAWRHAAAEVMDEIHANWDLSDYNDRCAADNINNEVIRGNYKAAVQMYNSVQRHSDCQSWVVYERKTLVGARAPKFILSLSDPDNEDDEETLPPTLRPPPLQTPGATCRGQCKTYNEYAYADRMDGTYVCTQCKTFSSIFGG